MTRRSIGIALVAGVWLAATVQTAEAAPCLLVTLTGTQSGPSVFNGQAGAGTLVRYGGDDRGAGNHYVDLTRYQILHRGGCSAIRHKLTTRASQLLKDNPGDVRRAADPACPHRCLGGICLQPGNQLAQVICG